MAKGEKGNGRDELNGRWRTSREKRVTNKRDSWPFIPSPRHFPYHLEFAQGDATFQKFLSSILCHSAFNKRGKSTESLKSASKVWQAQCECCAEEERKWSEVTTRVYESVL
jgi:hypothetical protein